MLLSENMCFIVNRILSVLFACISDLFVYSLYILFPVFCLEKCVNFQLHITIFLANTITCYSPYIKTSLSENICCVD
jgi:hypothetical protein